MNNSNAEQQAKNIAECTLKTPNKNASLGHKVILNSPQGTWADDITCPKNSGHKEFASEGHKMTECVWCGRVSPKASRNSTDKTVWTTSE